MNDQKPVLAGSVFASLVAEMTSAAQELEARRRFDADVAAWLAEHGFAKDFEAWRAQRQV